MRTTYQSLQYLRGIAALLVVVAHTTEYPITNAGDIPSWTSRTAGIGVLTFFVISGFIISIVAGPGRFDPVLFAWRRLLRVLPLYWLCTCFLFAVAALAPSLFKTTTANGPHFLLSLLFIPHPDPGYGANYWSPLLKPGWTLNFEMFFYALTASLFWCSTGRVRALLLTLILGALVGLSFADTKPLGVLNFYASKDLIAFISGIWLAQVTLSLRQDVRPSGLLCGIAAVGAGLFVVLTYLTPSDEISEYPTLLAAAGIVAAGLLIERAGLLPRIAPLKWIGDASYSLYLTHMFSVGAAWIVIRKLLEPESTGFAVIGIAFSIVVAVLVSLVSYRLVERPFVRLSHGRSFTRPAPDAPSAKVV